MRFLSSLFIALLQPIFTWYAERQANKATAEEQAMRQRALAAGDTIRDNAARQEDLSHAQTQADHDRLAADAGRPERVQSDDVNKAISATDGVVR